MRILIISIFFPPLNSIASHRPYSWAKRWSELGHDVTVLTTSKNEPLTGESFEVIEVPLPRWFGRLKQGYNRNQNKEKLSAIQTFRNKTGIFNSCRMPDITDLWVPKAYKAVRDLPKWDFVISTFGPYAPHLVAHRLKSNQRASFWIADYRDRWSDSCIYPGLFPFNKIEYALENWLLKKADLITAVSEPFSEVFRKRHPNHEVITIENGWDELCKSEIPRIFPEDGKIRLVFTGTIYQDKVNLLPLFEAIQHLRTNPIMDRVEFLFAGKNQANLGELINSYNAHQWVKQLGEVSRIESLAMQREAHALLFFPWKDPKDDGFLTGKLFEYLTSGTPIWAIGTPYLEASQKLILEAGAGYRLPYSQDVQNQLLMLSSEKEKIEVAPEFLKRYDRRALAEKLLEKITIRR